MATKDKLTLVQIRYMEKRINQTRDAAEKRIMREYQEAQEKLPKVKERSSDEVAKQIMMLHPTITRQMVTNLLGDRYYNGDRALALGVPREWLENKEAERDLKKQFDALTSRQRKAIGAIVDVATEATDAIYLGDASQLNTILSKMDKVKF